MRISRVIGSQHLGHARNLCSGFSDGANALTCDQNVDVATDFGSGGYGVQRGRGQGFTVVFCDYQDSHVYALQFKAPSLRFSVSRPVQPPT